jgi:alpha,alpha-trehalase
MILPPVCLFAPGPRRLPALRSRRCDAPITGTAPARRPRRRHPAVGGRARAAGAFDPARELGPLFADVQRASVFADSKTFVDARPLAAPAELAARYAAERGRPGFDLRAFVARGFAAPGAVGGDYRADTTQTMEAHIRALWPVLTRAADTADARSSRLPLPHPYVVPGGRFREVYYWDSYFTMLGLVESGRTDLVRQMLDNFAHLVRTVGHVPNGNRTYYLSRSQPPYFAAMVGLYARAADTARALRYLPALEREHAFWMDGAERLRPGTAYRRAVRLPDGALLNRYYDDRADPRPESYREDEALGRTLPEGAAREGFYRNTRAGAESGWDFSSRWMRDPRDLRTLEVLDLAPVDLNALLYNSERTIAAFRRARGGAGDAAAAARFDEMAEARRRAIVAHAFDPDSGFFYDVRWRTAARVLDRPTLAAATALYFGVAPAAEGRRTADRLGRDFLRPGGFVTTLVASGQQWDAPNGWPPLQWLAIEGARRYGRADLADTARARWLGLNRRVYAATGKMTEKYDVVDPSRRAGGGEYPTQDGFGWTNGVALALSAQERAARRSGALPTQVPAQLPSRGIAGADVPLVAPTVDEALARYLRHRLEGVIGLDTAVLLPAYVGARPGAPPITATDSVRESGARRELLTRILGARQTVHAAAIRCDGTMPSTCRMEGVDVLLQVSPSVVTGDSATVRVQLRTRSGLARIPIAWRSEVLRLVREGDGWRVVRTDLAAQS